MKVVSMITDLDYRSVITNTLLQVLGVTDLADTAMIRADTFTDRGPPTYRYPIFTVFTDTNLRSRLGPPTLAMFIAGSK